jgi:hypothetical protein
MALPFATPRMTSPAVIRRAWLPLELERKIKAYDPTSMLGQLVREMLLTYRLPSHAAAELLEAISRTVVVESSLAAVAIRGQSGTREDYGIVSRRVVTNNGVGFIVDAFQNLVELEIMKFHGIGTGTTAEAAADSALVTELTTEYNPNSTRATGTTTETSANIYQTVGTNTLDSGTPAITEHGVFSATSAGVLLDRSVFSAINLVGANGDGLQTTYSLTLSAGG